MGPSIRSSVYTPYTHLPSLTLARSVWNYTPSSRITFQVPAFPPNFWGTRLTRIPQREDDMLNLDMTVAMYMPDSLAIIAWRFQSRTELPSPPASESPLQLLS